MSGIGCSATALVGRVTRGWVLDRQRGGPALAQFENLPHGGHSQERSAGRAFIIEGFRQGVGIHERTVSIAAIGIAHLAMCLTQAETHGAGAVEVVLQIKAQRTQAAGPPDIQAEAGRRSVDRGVSLTAHADGDSCRDELVAVPCRTRIIDRVHLREPAQFYTRFRAGNGDVTA
jgi:hypothetical protein